MSLSEATQLVLDEADRMCDMGFEEPIKQVCGAQHTARLVWQGVWVLW